jgi:glutamate racemase
MPATARILVFDSGVGGLSILQEIRQQYPHCCFFYASDNAAFPYGTKTEDELIERVDIVLHQLQQTTQADIIVVACNTASTVALPRIRERFSQPVIGVVPAIKPAAAISQSKVIGLLATPGTVKREYTHQLIKKYAADCDIISIGSSELVQLAEQKLRGEIITQEQLKPIVQQLIEHATVDTLVLACTHFPLLKEELQTVLPNIKYWVDSGEAIARRVGYWLSELGLSELGLSELGLSELDFSLASPLNRTLEYPNNNIGYFTAQAPNIRQLQAALAEFNLSTIQFINVTSNSDDE